MKIYSICENHLFSKCYNGGKKYVGRFVVVYVLTDKSAYLLKKQNPLKQKLNRVGLTVTKKIGGAVIRSRIRRILREAYRQTEREYAIRKGYLIVISARHTAVKAKTGDIFSDLVPALKKSGLISAQNGADVGCVQNGITEKTETTGNDESN